MMKKSCRCFGETKFFRQCLRYIVVDCSVKICYCWEHEYQRDVRLEEQEIKIKHVEKDQLIIDDWEPIGAFISNRDELLLDAAATASLILEESKEKENRRLADFADDEQNVHTPEIQFGVNESIKKLKRWAMENGVKLQMDLLSTIQKSLLVEPSEIECQALEHIAHCYQWNDETSMFACTYPQLASWVWARVDREHENRELLRMRFFEEVSESAGQCLNGNMARLINIFAAIDPEMSPQDCGGDRNEDYISKEQLQYLISSKLKDYTHYEPAKKAVEALLKQARVPLKEWDDWLESVKEYYE
jgi:hypothetical protein